MLAQIEFSRSEQFRGFMERLPERLPAESLALIHSIFIDFHPVWKQLLDWVRTTGIGQPFPYPPYYLSFPTIPPGPYDPNDPRVPSAWENICKANSRYRIECTKSFFPLYSFTFTLLFDICNR